MAGSITTDNFLVMNQGNNPLVGFNFMLRVEGIYDLPCKSVKAFTKENEYEIIQEGGLNDYVHMRRKPISKPFTFEVERYVGVDYLDPLPNGAELMLPVILIVSRSTGSFAPNLAQRTYTFTGCTVTKKTYGELDGYKSGLLTETTTIAYRELLVVNMPWTGSNDVDFGTASDQHHSLAAQKKMDEEKKDRREEAAEKDKKEQDAYKDYQKAYEKYAPLEEKEKAAKKEAEKAKKEADKAKKEAEKAKKEAEADKTNAAKQAAAAAKQAAAAAKQAAATKAAAEESAAKEAAKDLKAASDKAYQKWLDAKKPT